MSPKSVDLMEFDVSFQGQIVILFYFYRFFSLPHVSVFTFAEVVMFSPLVHFLVDLLVCQQDYAKTAEQISTRLGWRTGLLTSVVDKGVFSSVLFNMGIFQQFH